MFQIAIACLVITSLLAYVTHPFVGLPTTARVVGCPLLSLLASSWVAHFGVGTIDA